MKSWVGIERRKIRQNVLCVGECESGVMGVFSIIIVVLELVL